MFDMSSHEKCQIYLAVNPQNPISLIRTIIGQFLKGNKIAPLKIQNGGNYAHAQHLNAYNFLFELKFS